MSDDDDDDERFVWRSLFTLAALGVVLWSAIDAFGVLHGFGVFGARVAAHTGKKRGVT